MNLLSLSGLLQTAIIDFSTLSILQEVKSLTLSGGASPYRPLWGSTPTTRLPGVASGLVDYYYLPYEDSFFGNCHRIVFWIQWHVSDFQLSKVHGFWGISWDLVWFKGILIMNSSKEISERTLRRRGEEVDSLQASCIALSARNWAQLRENFDKTFFSTLYMMMCSQIKAPVSVRDWSMISSFLCY